jgi:lipoic acid synthetase
VVKELGLSHIVVTSVNRDDLPDGGSSHFAETISWIKFYRPDIRVEGLIPDFKGDQGALETVVHSGIDILNHNLETVPRLYRKVRPGAGYERSLTLLRRAKEMQAKILTKSGLMLGVGETRGEVMEALKDLRRMDCDIVTLGQYLQPSAAQLPVEEYIPPSEFQDLEKKANDLGFRHVEASPLVRSSYHAWSHCNP